MRTRPGPPPAPPSIPDVKPGPRGPDVRPEDEHECRDQEHTSGDVQQAADDSDRQPQRKADITTSASRATNEPSRVSPATASMASSIAIAMSSPAITRSSVASSHRPASWTPSRESTTPRTINAGSRHPQLPPRHAGLFEVASTARSRWRSISTVTGAASASILFVVQRGGGIPGHYTGTINDARDRYRAGRRFKSTGTHLVAPASVFSCQKRVVTATRTARGEPGVMLVLLCALR